MMPDFPVYDHAAAERGWVAMLVLFERNLHHGGGPLPDVAAGRVVE